MSVRDILRQLGSRLSVEMELSSENTCAVEFDGLGVHFEAANGELYVIAELGNPGNPEKIAPALLKGNFPGAKTAGATISIDPSTGCVLLHMILDEEVNYDYFEKSLTRFVTIARYWRIWLEAPTTTTGAKGEGEGIYDPSMMV